MVNDLAVGTGSLVFILMAVVYVLGKKLIEKHERRGQTPSDEERLAALPHPRAGAPLRPRLHTKKHSRRRRSGSQHQQPRRKPAALVVGLRFDRRRFDQRCYIRATCLTFLTRSVILR